MITELRKIQGINRRRRQPGSAGTGKREKAGTTFSDAQEGQPVHRSRGIADAECIKEQMYLHLTHRIQIPTQNSDVHLDMKKFELSDKEAKSCFEILGDKKFRSQNSR